MTYVQHVGNMSFTPGRCWSPDCGTAWEVCVSYLFLSSFKWKRRCHSSQQATWTVVLAQYNCCCFHSKLIIQCLLSWICSFHLCTLRKIESLSVTMQCFLFGWSKDDLCYSKNHDRSAGWVCWRDRVNGFMVLKDFEGHWGMIFFLLTLMDLLLCLKLRSFLSSLRQWWGRKKYCWSCLDQQIRQK